MADKKITELVELSAAAVTADDLLVIVDQSEEETKKIKASVFGVGVKKLSHSIFISRTRIEGANTWMGMAQTTNTPLFTHNLGQTDVDLVTLTLATYQFTTTEACILDSVQMLLNTSLNIQMAIWTADAGATTNQSLIYTSPVQSSFLFNNNIGISIPANKSVHVAVRKDDTNVGRWINGLMIKFVK